MHYLQVCAVVKDERYLPEWVEYHRIVGVEHFYIYDGGASPGASLEKEVREGFVTVIPFPGKAQQFNAYNHYLQNFKKTSRWVAFIDADEFLVPTRSDDLRDLLRNYEGYGGLAVSWLVFGSSFYILRPKGTQIESYRLRRLYLPDMCSCVKSIVQANHAIAVNSAHTFVYEDGYICVNEKFQPISEAIAKNSVETIQLNHYFTRSLLDFVEKIRRGRADIGGRRSLAEFFEMDHYANAVYDDTILRFLPELTNRLNRKAQDKRSWKRGWILRRLVYSILFYPLMRRALAVSNFAPLFASDRETPRPR